MKTLEVSASTKYDIHIGKGIIKNAGELIRKVKRGGKVIIVSDDIVFALYGKALTDSLTEAGFDVGSFVFDNGEKSKNIDTVLEALRVFSEEYITREDVVVALGGGVVGDLCGFAASIYLRGIPFVQIPTTLLAMVDSSVGGKTGVNSSFGKNLIGSFYQPELVICDTRLLATLNENVFVDGICETIKYAVIRDRSLFELLGTKNSDIDDIIESCLRIKSAIIKEDEFDNGIRQLLNFGHTIGHAIEVLSGYKITHGKAVAKGMAAITKAAQANAMCQKGTYERILGLLAEYGINTSIEYGAGEIANVALSDKKRRNDKLALALPKCIGQAYLRDFGIDELESFFSSGVDK